MNALIRSLAEGRLPILIVAAAGCPFQRLIPLDIRSISRMARYVCIPAPILRLLDRTDISPAERLRMVAFGATMLAVIAVLAFGIGRALRLESVTLSGPVLATTILGPLPLTPLLMVRSA